MDFGIIATGDIANGPTPRPVAVNDNGDYLMRMDGRYGYRALKLYTGGQLKDVPGYVDGGFNSVEVNAFNNLGHFVGTRSDLGAFFYNGQTTISLPLYSGRVVKPTALNNKDEIVGTVAIDTVGNTRGVKYEGGQWVLVSQLLLDSYPGVMGVAETADDINDKGEIIGSGQFSSSTGKQQPQGYKLTPNGDWQRTIVFIYGQTQTGQDMFVRGGIDHAYAQSALGRTCTSTNMLCAMPIRHLNLRNTTTTPWKQNDLYLDWYGTEPGQSTQAQGTPLDWSTNLWPSTWGAKKTVEIDGYGETPLNQYGAHYWMMDVMMNCSATVNGWFELKSFISNGPGWEANVTQAGAPYASGNHFAQCGKINVFRRGENSAVFAAVPKP